MLWSRRSTGGASAEEIVGRFPTLDLAAVYAAIAYVLAQRGEVDAYVATRQGICEKLAK
jgi:uncharacterized protein (DUF433 family)